MSNQCRPCANVSHIRPRIKKKTAMTRLSLGLAVAFLSISTALFSQEKKPIVSMDDAILKGRTTLAPGNFRQLQWLPGSQSFSHVLDNKIVRVDAESLEGDTLIWLPAINEGIEKSGGKALKNFPAMTWLTDTSFFFQQENSVFTYSRKAGLKKVVAGPEDLANTDFEPKSMRLAATDAKASVLKIFDSNGKETVVARGEKDGIVVGKSVHREEYGIEKGTFWSPRGAKLAFYRMDESMVTEYPIYVLDSMPATDRKIRYPFAGATSHEVTVGVFDVASGRTVFLKTTGPKDQYLTNIAWTPDEKHVLIAVLNRKTDHCWVNLYDAETGDFEKTLFEETNEKWVEPMVAPVFVPGHPSHFLWQSQRGGFNQLYLYDLKGGLIRQVSKGDFPVVKLLGFDESGGVCFYQTADESGMNRYVWQAPLMNGEPKKLADRVGTHGGLVSSDGNRWLDVFSDEKTPRNIYCGPVGEKGTVVFSSKNPLMDVQTGRVVLGKIMSPGKVELNVRTILPANFDEKKKYPAIVYLYNGPHVQLVTNTWQGGAELWMHRMAALGYVVFTLDGRGSANRGWAFESAIYRQLGTAEIEDQLEGVRFLKSQPYIDSTRLAIWGWSFGGFMATSLMTRTPGVFKVGVAGGPVIDWRMYEIMYTERYMDTPAENPEGYKKASLFQYIPNLKGKLLMIHGTEDNTVLWQHSLKYVQECVSKGKQVDYFVYPGHEHNVVGKDRVHLFNKIEGYILQNL